MLRRAASSKIPCQNLKINSHGIEQGNKSDIIKFVCIVAFTDVMSNSYNLKDSNQKCFRFKGTNFLAM